MDTKDFYDKLKGVIYGQAIGDVKSQLASANLLKVFVKLDNRGGEI